MSSSGYRKRAWRLRTFACAVVAVLVCVCVAGFVGMPSVSGQVGGENQGQSEQAASSGAESGSHGQVPASDGVEGAASESASPAGEASGEGASGAQADGSGTGGASTGSNGGQSGLWDASALPEHVALDEVSDVVSVGAEHEADTVLLSVGDGASADKVNDVLGHMDFVTTKDVSDQDFSLGFVELSLVPGTDVARAVYTLEETGVTEGAQPNYIYHLLDDEANGPTADVAAVSGLAAASTDLQSQSTNVNDPTASSQWALEAVHAFEAWDIVKTGKAVTVAVVDDGCIVDHEDLKNNIVASYNAISGGTDVSHVTSSYHGTHVAGIIAAEANNKLGVAGVSYNAALLPIQVFKRDNSGSEGASSETIATAFTYIKKHASKYNIKVVNMSVGGELSSYDGSDKLLIDAIESAYDAGIVTVCAAGNKSEDASAYKCFPVDYSELTVGVMNLEQNEDAADESGVSVHATSNYNMSGQTTKDICAPGYDIWSTYGAGTDDYSNGPYGTSMASPLVAGIVALEFAADPDLTAEEAVTALYDGATDLLGNGTWDEQTGYGMVDAYNTLQALEAGLSGADVVGVGESIQLKTTKYASSTWSWSSSDTGIATVDSSGKVTGVSEGTVSISATFGSLAVSKEIIVHDSAFSKSTYVVQKGRSVSLSISSVLSGSWTVKSSDSSIAKFASKTSLNMKGVSQGMATITATNSTYGVVITAEVAVYDPTIVDADGVSNLSVLTDRTLTVKLEGQPEGGEWTWTSKKAGVATIAAGESDSSTATVKGIASGSATIVATATIDGSTFEVSSTVNVGTIALTDETTRITFSEDSFTYSPVGSCEPDFTVEYSASGSDGSWVELDSDCYECTYANNRNAGTATLTVSGANGYAGNVTAEFTIEPRSFDDVSISQVAAQSYTGSSLRPSVSVSDKVTSTYYIWFGFRYVQMTRSTNCALAAGSDYTLSYKNNVDAGTATVTVTGTGNYTGTKSTTFTIDRSSISNAAVGSVSARAYTGSAITPALSITYLGKSLKAGIDYTLAYSDNVNVGTAIVTISGTGNFKGTRSIPFAITPASVESATVSGLSSRTYTGSAIKPVPAVTLGGKTLALGTDYTIGYSGNVKVGWAYVIVKGAGNYTGTKYAMFRIAKAGNSIALGKTLVKKTLKAKSLKKKAATVALPKVVSAFGTVEWSVYKRDAKKALSLYNGKVRVKKNAKKGTYTIKLRAMVSGNSNYASAISKIVTVKVKVK